jgi:hypothetical protein
VPPPSNKHDENGAGTTTATATTMSRVSQTETVLIMHSGVIPMSASINWDMNPLAIPKSSSKHTSTTTPTTTPKVISGDVEVDALVAAYELHQGATVKDSVEEATYSFHWKTQNVYKPSSITSSQPSPPPPQQPSTTTKSTKSHKSTPTTTPPPPTTTTTSEGHPRRLQGVVMSSFSDLLLGIALPHHVNTIDIHVNINACYFPGKIAYLTLKVFSSFLFFFFFFC